MSNKVKACWNSGGDAFPSETFESRGLTKREWFAGMVLQGINANQTYDSCPTEKMAEFSFRVADAMLKEGAK